MKNKRATLIGATGLIGSHLLELLQKDPEFPEIKVLVRRPVTFDHPRIKVIVIDFGDVSSFKSAVAESDVIFCAVGTTNKKVKGDKTEYRKVDYDIPVNAARFGLATGCRQFVLVSSLGASSKNNNFYLKLKGEVEDTISALNFPSFLIFRPSLLLGKRQEFRLGELVGAVLMKPLSFLLPLKMRPIQASDVAKAMTEAAKSKAEGLQIYQYKEMIQLIGK